MELAMHHSAQQCRFFLREMQELVSDLSDAQRGLQARAGGKTAGWLIGHMAVTGDFARRLCGRTPICPKEWRAEFNPGSQPTSNVDAYPSMEVLCYTAQAVYRDLCEAAIDADPASLAIVNPYAPARADMPTVDVFVRYLMTGHLAYHLGQLSEWRSAAGLPSRRQIDTAA